MRASDCSRAGAKRIRRRWTLAQHVAMPLQFGSLRDSAVQRATFHGPRVADGESPHRIRTTPATRACRALTERVLTNYVRERSNIGIHNAAALLVDYRDMSVRAMVGSADFDSVAIDGQVNGTLAKRSPGSALKPFIYALAIDQGLIHPLTVLKDAPTSFGPYSPENFDGRFVGPITATDALTRSRNVPAVSLSAQLTQPSLYDFLRVAGISQLASEQHYGLALTLGGGEVTTEETATLYAMLANRGRLAPLRYLAGESARRRRVAIAVGGSELHDARHAAQRAASGRCFRAAPQQRARRLENRHVLGIPRCVDRGRVRPLRARRVGRQLRRLAATRRSSACRRPRRCSSASSTRSARNRKLVEPAYRQPPRLERVDVCSASGDLPNAECPQTASTWYIPGVSPIRVSQVHRRVWIDTRTGEQACPPYDPIHTR